MSNRIEYTPLPPPVNKEQVGNYIQAELVRIAGFLGDLSETTFQEQVAEPPRPVNGQLVFANGTDWNPGSGRGLYQYRSGLGWVFIN